MIKRDEQNTSALATLVKEVEGLLAHYYDFAPVASAAEHLVSSEQIQKTCAELSGATPPRGQVVLVDDDDESLYVGVNYAPAVTSLIEHHPPIERLDDENLDAFCVVVEEISHFHLIINRATAGRQVTRLELEWQGEIDKLLVSGLILQRQYGQPHLLPLARRLFDLAIIDTVDADQHETYWQATKHAARFWFGAIPVLRDLPRSVEWPPLVELLRRVYRAPWAEKLKRLEQTPLKKAS